MTLTGQIGVEAQDGALLGYVENSPDDPTSQRWQTSVDGGSVWTDIAGADGPTTLVDLASSAYADLNYVRVGVTVEGHERFSNAAQMVYATPVVLAPLADQSFEADTGLQFLASASAFAGENLSYAISGPGGTSIDAATGMVRFETGVLQPQAGTQVTVTASNSGGAVTVGFDLEISAGVVVDYTASIIGLTDNPLHGPSAQIGSQLTGIIGNLQGGETVLHRWQDDSGLIAGAETPSYAPLPDQDLELLQYVPLIDGVSAASAAQTIRYPATDLVMTIETTAPDETFTFPMRAQGTYAGTVDMGDGSGAQAFSDFNDPAFTATYPAAGIHTIRMRGTAFAPYFPNASEADRLKLRTVQNLGDLGWQDMFRAFDGCAGMTEFVSGVTDISPATNGYSMFAGCSALVTCDIRTMDFANFTNLQQVFRNCVSLNAVDLTNVDTGNVTRMDEMFEGCPAGPNIDISGFDCTSLSTDGGMFNFVTTDDLDQTVYDQFLINLDAQAPLTAGVFYGFLNTPVTIGGAAEAARTNLINRGLYFTDGLTAAPDAMAAPTLTAGSTDITATLAGEPFNNGLPVFSYDIRISTDQTNWTEITDVDPDEDGLAAVDNLTAGTDYYVQTAAVNFRGRGDWSASATITTEIAASFSIDLTDDEAVYTFPETDDPISLTFPGSDYAGSFTEDVNSTVLTGNFFAAEVAADRDVRLTNPTVSVSGSTANQIVLLPGLLFFGGDPQEDSTFQWCADGVDIPGAVDVTYDAQQAQDGVSFTVAETANGITVVSDALVFSFSVTVPAMMGSPTLRALGSEDIEVTLAADPSDNGATILSRDLEYSIDVGATWTAVTGVTSPHTITGLNALDSVLVRTRAVNGEGAGTYSDPAAARTAAGANFDILGTLDAPGIDLIWAAYDFKDATQLYTDTGRTTQVANDNDNILGIADATGRGHHLDANRPGVFTWNSVDQQSEIIPGSGFDFRLETLVAAADLPDLFEIYVALKKSASSKLRFVTVGNGENYTANVLTAVDGSSGLTHGGAGSPLVSIGQTDLVTQESGELFDAVVTGSKVVMGARNVDSTILKNDVMQFFNWNVNYQLDAANLAYMIITHPLSDLQRLDLISKLETMEIV